MRHLFSSANTTSVSFITTSSYTTSETKVGSIPSMVLFPNPSSAPILNKSPMTPVTPVASLEPQVAPVQQLANKTTATRQFYGGRLRWKILTRLSCHCRD